MRRLAFDRQVDQLAGHHDHFTYRFAFQMALDVIVFHRQLLDGGFVGAGRGFQAGAQFTVHLYHQLDAVAGQGGFVYFRPLGFNGGLLMALLGAQEDLRGQWFIVGEEAEKISKRKPMGKEAT